MQAEASKKDSTIAELKAKLDATETEKKLAVQEALGKVEKERDKLSADLQMAGTKAELESKSLKELYEDRKSVV